MNIHKSLSISGLCPQSGVIIIQPPIQRKTYSKYFYEPYKGLHGIFCDDNAYIMPINIPFYPQHVIVITYFVKTPLNLRFTFKSDWTQSKKDILIGYSKRSTTWLEEISPSSDYISLYTFPYTYYNNFPFVITFSKVKEKRGNSSPYSLLVMITSAKGVCLQYSVKSKVCAFYTISPHIFFVLLFIHLFVYLFIFS